MVIMVSSSSISINNDVSIIRLFIKFYDNLFQRVITIIAYFIVVPNGRRLKTCTQDFLQEIIPCMIIML